MRIRPRIAAAAKKLDGVDRKRDAGASGDDECASDRGAEDADEVPGETLQRIGLLQPGGADTVCGTSPTSAGITSPPPSAVEDREADQRPDLSGVRQDERRDGGLRTALDQRRADEDEVAG